MSLSLPSIQVSINTNEQAERDQQRRSINEQDPKWIFIRPDGTPSEFVITLLQMDGLYDPKDQLAQVVEKTQRNWIAVRQGQGNKERTDIRDNEVQKAREQSVETLIRKMNLLEERAPILKKYDHAACPGAFLDAVRSRLGYLVKVWEEKQVRYDNLVFLTGERNLRKGPGQEDDIAKLTQLSSTAAPVNRDWKPSATAKYETEYDMIRLIWEQRQLSSDMERALTDKVEIVNALKGEQNRVDTKGTCQAWTNQEPAPKPGTVVVASSPLLWAYQHLTVQNALGSQFIVDTVAPGVSPALLEEWRPRLVGLVQDTVAKCLYEISRSSFVPQKITFYQIQKRKFAHVVGSADMYMTLRSQRKVHYNPALIPIRRYL